MPEPGFVVYLEAGETIYQPAAIKPQTLGFGVLLRMDADDMFGIVLCLTVGCFYPRLEFAVKERGLLLFSLFNERSAVVVRGVLVHYRLCQDGKAHFSPRGQQCQ